MTKRLTLFRVALYLAVTACSSPASEDRAEKSILVFSRTEAFRHASIEPGVAALRQMASDADVAFAATEDAGDFTGATLGGYDAVVFLSTTGDVLDDTQQAALEAFIRGGGGFVGIHSASDTEYGWPWYGELVGAYFESHPPRIRTATLLVVDADHPATEGLESPWVRDDEWYDLRDMQSGLSILLEIDETSYKMPGESPVPEPRPIAWYREFDGGRTFYTALGHTSESYDEPEFRAHIWGGIAWVLRR